MISYQSNPDDLEALLKLGAAFEAAAEDPSNLPPPRNRSELLASLVPNRTDLKDGAFDAYFKAAELHRDDWRALYQLANLFFGDGNCSAVKEAAEMAWTRAERLDERERRRALQRIGNASSWASNCDKLPKH